MSKLVKLALGGAVIALLGASLVAAQPPAAPGGAPGAAPARPRGPGLVLPDAPGGVKPTPNSPGYRQGSTDGVQNKQPEYEDVWAMIDALPDSAPAKPKKARRVLVYSRTSGFAHSAIPLTAWTIKEMGEHTGAWTADISFDLKDFTAANLAKYDVLVLNNTTGAFLDDKDDAAGTEARKKALLEYVRAGHGVAMFHGAMDSYHTQANAPGGIQPTWPEFNKMGGGIFKWHWFYPQAIPVKLDDPKSPINAGFGGKGFTVHEELYTFTMDSFSRKNVHVLNSIDYAKMSAEDKAKEDQATKRTDGDYAISWIRREGQGRVFYTSLGHSEHVLAMPAVLKQMAAGIQYAAGDLAADDSPSQK